MQWYGGSPASDCILTGSPDMMSLALLLALSADPALPLPAERPAPEAPTAIATAPKDGQRVCVVSRLTGSMIPKKTCKTLRDWRALGVDPLAKR